MTRDQFTALAIDIAKLAIAAAVLYAIGSWLGWPWVAALVGAALADSVRRAARLMARLPTRWRYW